MSPEQARGKPVDRRADIWAFGCVLFEMLTGRQTFEGGETVTDTVAAIIKNEPDWTALPGETPAHIRALLKRCLRKDPKRRLRDIGDARLELEEGPLGPSDVVATVGAGLQAAPTRASVLAWALAAAAIIVALALATVILRHREPADFGTVRLSIAPSEGETFGHSSAPRGAGPPAPHFAPSPDGKRLAYIMYAAEKPPQLWVQRLDALSGQPLPGTDDASFPFWSPDSRFIGFFAQGKLKKIDASGGPPQTICDAPYGEGGTWNRDGDIVFARDEASGLSRVSAAGGVPAALTALDATSHETSHRWPQFLPDGRHFLYLAMTGAVRGAPRTAASVGNDRSLYVGSLDAAAPIPILKDVLRGQYASGRLLFIKDTTLMAQPFDTKQWRLTGDPVSLAEQVARNADNGRTALGASDGVLMYRIDARAGGTSRLAWFDRAGKRLGSVGAPADYAGIQLAPDGKAVATYILDAATNNGDLWTVDLARGGIPSRLTLTSDQAEVGAAWSPDGTRVAYATGPGVGNMSDLYAKPTNGVRDAELLLKSGRGMHATSWSPDGRYIAFQQTDLKTGLDIWLLPLAGDRKPVPFLQSSFAEGSAAFSPDGRWIAYTSDKGGSVSTDVYVRPFPSGDREWRVSQAGGSYPQWRGDGQELYYVDLSTSAVMAVAITGGATLEPAPPVKLFTSPLIRVFGRGRHYTVTADGQRFLMIEPGASAQSTGQAPILVVVNWAAALRK